MPRPLGRHQITVLGALARHNRGSWDARCAWRFRSLACTVRVLDSLVQRGHVTRTSATERYTIAESGLNVLGWYTCEACTRLTRSPVIEEVSVSRRRVQCSWCHPGGAARPRAPRAERTAR
ncbi:hypothetical protein [Streptomyces marianii]|uniref:Uncharacterized protein n=1 Tax=Streptomyces marianii TaxID=1817406 RepID=A0A5R9DWQ1_9ACTN|nr:hypothetical protein [Streptomyces marianii]TLQ39292.1 hypothetical protein FEF34_38520 [Streptomyces marianii]